MNRLSGEATCGRHCHRAKARRTTKRIARRKDRQLWRRYGEDAPTKRKYAGYDD